MDSEPIKLPGRRVIFTKSEEKDAYEATFELKNESGMEVAYKIKRHSETKYAINPYIETIKPGESRVVSFSSNEKPRREDKFLIESLFVIEGVPIAQLFPKGKGSEQKTPGGEPQKIFKACFGARVAGEEEDSLPPQECSSTEFKSIISEEESPKKEEEKEKEKEKEQEKEQEKEEEKPLENNGDDVKKVEIEKEKEIEVKKEEIKEEEKKEEIKEEEKKEEVKKEEEKKEEVKKVNNNAIQKPGAAENLYYLVAGIIALIGVFLVLFK